MRDNSFFDKYSTRTKIQLYLKNDHWILINRFLRYLRKEESYIKKHGILAKILSYYWGRRKNNLGNKLGFLIPPFVLGENVTIYHHGGIIINGNARIGKNCILHGMNCIGNNGFSDAVPEIGDNVDIGIGAKIIGGVQIADNIVIGANAVVINSCTIKGAVLVGVPARMCE